jgi:hypothetical protein
MIRILGIFRMYAPFPHRLRFTRLMRWDDRLEKTRLEEKNGLSLWQSGCSQQRKVELNSYHKDTSAERLH